MAPGKRIQGLQSYRTPLTGHETHKSGFEVTQQRIFEKKVRPALNHTGSTELTYLKSYFLKEAEYQSRLKNMKPSIDFSPPKSTMLKVSILIAEKTGMDSSTYKSCMIHCIRLILFCFAITAYEFESQAKRNRFSEIQRD
jgi:hypothetical protein